MADRFMSEIHQNEPAVSTALTPDAGATQPHFHESQLTRFNLYLTESPGIDCNFWLGLARRGGKTPQNVMAQPTVAAMLDDAATEGLAEEAPMMLSDTTQVPSQYLYLMPVPETEFRDRSLWIHSILETIKNWAPQKIGIYLHPAVMASEPAKELLRSILTALIETTGIKNYFLLVGSHGVNDLINTALTVKSELETSDREVVVFH
jgi:hypothetical protein